jgi:uncharacterized protein (DUF1697 family)
MAGLRSMLTDLGYADVATLLQSGNALFTTDGSPATVAGAIEQRLHAELGLSVRCLVRGVGELRAAIEADPFAGVATDPARYVIAFLSEPPAANKVTTIDPAAFVPDEFRLLGREAYIWCPNGLRDTKFTAPFFEKRLGVVATARNWNTCRKLLALAEE